MSSILCKFCCVSSENFVTLDKGLRLCYNIENGGGPMEKKRTAQINYIQWLRVIAAAAVVIAHTDGQLWMSIPWDTRDWKVLSFYDGLVRWPVLMFLMITGTIFLPRRTAPQSILKRSIPRVLTAFVFWSAVYTLDAWLDGSGENLLLKFVGGHYHLWYLPFLCGVYLTVPFLQKIAEDEQLTKWLLGLSVVFGLLIPWGANTVACVWPQTDGVVRSLANSLNYTFFLDLLALLPLGYFLSRTEFSPRARGILYAAGILGAVLTGLGTIWTSARMETYSSVFCTNASPTVVLPGMAIFVFAKYNLNALPKVVSWIADRSFGIYLVHALVTENLQQLGFHVLMGDPVWAVPVVSVAVFAISLTISALLHRIPVVGKYLV